MDPSETVAALNRAGRRVAFHLLQAAVEGLKAVEAVIEELGALGADDDEDDSSSSRQRIDIE